MLKTFLAITLMAPFLCANLASAQGNPGITLSNNVVDIKLLPEVGGRLVSACLIGRENILNSDPSQWIEPKEKRPTMNPHSPQPIMSN